MKDTVQTIVGWATIAVLALSTIIAMGWLLGDYNVIEFKRDYKTEKTEYFQGDRTYYSVDYCKYLDYPATISKEFVDGLVFTAVSPQAKLRLGCREQTVEMDIPVSLPPGKYRLRNTITYQVNPLRTVEYVRFSNWFTVKERE